MKTLSCSPKPDSSKIVPKPSIYCDRKPFTSVLGVWYFVEGYFCCWFGFFVLFFRFFWGVYWGIFKQLFYIHEQQSFPSYLSEEGTPLLLTAPCQAEPCCWNSSGVTEKPGLSSLCQAPNQRSRAVPDLLNPAGKTGRKEHLYTRFPQQ